MWVLTYDPNLNDLLISKSRAQIQTHVSVLCVCVCVCVCVHALANFDSSRRQIFEKGKQGKLEKLFDKFLKSEKLL